MEEIRTGFVGLATNVSSITAPSGALLKAEDVVIRRPGVIEPRPGLVALSPYSTVDVHTSMTLDGNQFWFQFATGIYRGSSSTRLSIYELTASTAKIPVSFTSSAFERDGISSVVAGDRLIIATDAGLIGVHKDLTSWQNGITTGVLRYALASLETTTGSFLANNEQVAYRLVVKRVWSNGAVSRSGPTGRYVITNTSGSAKDVQMYLIGQNDGGSTTIESFDRDGSFSEAFKDYVEIYRSGNFSTSVEIDEEYALVATVGASEFIAGTANYWTYPHVDHVLPTDRGLALYTSPSREGILGSNELATPGKYVELYKGHLFSANTKSYPSKKISFNWDGSISASATGIGYRTLSTTLTNGSASATVSSTTGIKVGMVVQSASGSGIDNIDWGGNCPVTVSAVVNATTLTLSHSFTGTTAAYNVNFVDSVMVGGGVNRIIPLAYCYHGGAIDAPSQEALLELPIMHDNDSDSAAHVRSEYYYAYRITPPEPGYTHTIVVVQKPSAGIEPFDEIWATHGDEMDPPIEEDLTAGTGTSLDQDVFVNGLAWSKKDEIDHFAPTNFAFVGSSSQHIRGIASTRDALFIFKEDGIWRLSGDNGDFRIDPFDLTTYVVKPSSIQKMDGKIYALTNRGFVRVSDSGVEVISDSIKDEVSVLIKAYQDDWVTNGDYRIGSEYSAACVNPRESEYMCIVGSSMPTLSGILVYNARTGAWTTWKTPSTNGFAMTVSSLGWSDVSNAVVVGVENGAYRTTTDSDTLTVQAVAFPARTNGAGQSITITSVSGTTVQYTGGVAPEAGDIIVDDDSNMAVIDSVTSTGATREVEIYTADGLSVTTGTLYSSVKPVVLPHPFSRDPRAHKHWGYVGIGFAEFTGPLYANLGFYSSGRTSASAALNDVDQPLRLTNGAAYNFPDYNNGTMIRAIVPRQVARAWKLWAELSWYQAWGDARLEIIHTVGSDGGQNRPGLTADGSVPA